MTTQNTLDLQPLEDAYEIIGELGASDSGRAFIGRRREDGADALILVAGHPSGDEGNALGHLASDATRLTELRHRNLLPVLDGRWLGADAFALVVERSPFPTLKDLLSRRDEAFSFPRVATILQEVNAALEWARSQKIVHRAIAPDMVYLEPGSDRVQVVFVPRPLPLADMPGAEHDARMIATLARAMLTRSVADPERAELPLAELRPGLPERVVEQTEALLNAAPDAAVPDVTEYIAHIAMADALKRSETEYAEAIRRLVDEERVTRERLEAERQSVEGAAAEQARLFAEERETFAREKASIEQKLREEREAFAREKAGIEEELGREHAILARERQECGADRAAFLSEREEHKQWAAAVEKQFDARRSALAGVDARDRQSGEDARPEHFAPVVLPPTPKLSRVAPEWRRGLTRAWERRPRWNPAWRIPAAAAALVLLIALSAVALGRRFRDAPDAPAQRELATVPTTMRDSAAGAVARAAGAEAVPGIPADFATAFSSRRSAGVPADLIAGVAARRDSAQARPSGSALPANPGPSPSQARSTAPSPPIPAPPGRDTAIRVDTVFRAPALTIPAPPTLMPPIRLDSAARRDTLPRLRPDSTPLDAAID